MFTGIIEAVGEVASVRPAGDVAVIRILGGGLDLSDISIGDSVAVNGICLTVTKLDAGAMEFDVSAETLRVTTGFQEGDRVNLEKSLRLDARIGGHLVTGHVDAIGEVADVVEHEGNRNVRLRFPDSLARYVARKGSVTVNGVSLTVNNVDANECSVNLIPHTLSATNLDSLESDSRVNLEIDLVARYVERMMTQAESDS